MQSIMPFSRQIIAFGDKGSKGKYSTLRPHPPPQSLGYREITIG